MQVDATDLIPKCYMATPARSIVGPSGHALQHYHGAPPIILKERPGRGRLAAHGLSFSIINKSPGGIENAHSVRRFLDFQWEPGREPAGTAFHELAQNVVWPRPDAQTGTGTGREPTGTGGNHRRKCVNGERLPSISVGTEMGTVHQ